MLDRVPGGTTESRRDGRRRSRATSTQALASPSAAPASANSTLWVTGKAPGGRTSAATANVATAERPSEATKRRKIAWRLRLGRRLPTSAEILVRLHVEPHRKQRELRAGDQEQGNQDDGADAHLVPGDPVADLDRPEDEPGQRGKEAERVEEDERVEVPDHVLLPQPPEEALQEQPRDPRDDLVIPDARALAHPVDRTGGKVADARVPHVEVHEEVVREAVARVHAIEIEPGEHLLRDRGVAGLRVGDVPVAGRDLRQHREDRVAEV